MLLILQIRSLKNVQAAGGFYSWYKDTSILCLLVRGVAKYQKFIKKALIIRRKAAGSSWKTQSCLTVELLSLPVALQYQHCHSLSSWPVRSSRLKNVCEWKNVALTRNQQMIWEACQLRISVCFQRKWLLFLCAAHWTGNHVFQEHTRGLHCSY